MSAEARPTRIEMLTYFENLLGPHLDPDIYDRTDDDLYESYKVSLAETDDKAS
jgi:hypothetical protein